MILNPYSNRGERIGVHISMYEERDREIIEYVLYLRPEQTERSFPNRCIKLLG